jgi:alkanesulfonate monooxygenase SsuD/methylene tetrahydromethanopterin reductase-like flavin-dependent oxidoreductase (luciferase family)
MFTVAPHEPFDYEGRFYRLEQARNVPGPVQQPRPPIWLGGKGPKLAALAARKADGWNTGWQAWPDDYVPRAEQARQHAPDPDVFHLSLCLYGLVGEDERDLRRRFERLKQHSPPGVVDPDTTLDDYRDGRLVGTVEQVHEQLHQWAEVGVRSVIVCLGPVPFSLTDIDDLDVFAGVVTRSA